MCQEREITSIINNWYENNNILGILIMLPHVLIWDQDSLILLLIVTFSLIMYHNGCIIMMMKSLLMKIIKTVSGSCDFYVHSRYVYLIMLHRHRVICRLYYTVQIVWHLKHALQEKLFIFPHAWPSSSLDKWCLV